MSNEDLARLAYSAYGQSTGGLNFQGNPMPTWENLPERIKLAWEVTVISVRTALNVPVS